MKSKYTKEKGEFYHPHPEHVFNFQKRLDELGFVKVSQKDILISVLEQGMEKPDRATPGNALQMQYKRKSQTGYSVYIHVGLIDTEFSEKGSSWVLILNKDGKKVWAREFYRNFGSLLLSRLAAFAHLACSIADAKVPEWELVEVSETEDSWLDLNTGQFVLYFNYKNYIYGLSKEDKAIVKKKEENRIRYLKNTAGKVRRERTFRKKWKKG